MLSDTVHLRLVDDSGNWTTERHPRNGDGGRGDEASITDRQRSVEMVTRGMTIHLVSMHSTYISVGPSVLCAAPVCQ